MTNIRLPMAVCAVVAEVLEGSHQRRDALFESAGVPGPPPGSSAPETIPASIASLCDLMLHTDRRTAESMYSDVLKIESANDDAQKSEVIARAYLKRGKVRTDLGDKEKALKDFQQAAKIWDELKDPTADFAHWEIERTAPWVDEESQQLLTREPVGVRVRAARIVSEETTQRSVARSHRRKLSQPYLRGVISQAKERWAVERPVW